jgi:imidazolonepropionase-like amidohydrolase
MVLRVKGVCLPDEVERVLFIDGDRIREDPVASAETILDGGWLVPGLVDMHTHPGVRDPGDPFDDDLFREQLEAHRAAGVLTIRCPGLAARLPSHLREPSPIIIAAGPWLAAPGGFFEGWGRQLALDDLPAAAEEEAKLSDGWCKVIADWASTEDSKRRYGPTIPAEVLSEIVRRVHAVGARIAVHTQHADGAEAAVLAGADTIEHGMHMRTELLDRMAAQGTAFVPTMDAFASTPAYVAAQAEPDEYSRYMLEGSERHPSLVRAAWEAGVTVLAGTDDLPHGNVAAEVSKLADAGLPPEVALGAASWTALEYLGLRGLEDGALANVVAYERDPREPAELRRPVRVIAAGKVVA